MSEYVRETQRGWLVGFCRASKYLVIATLIEDVLLFLLLWWLISIFLSFFSLGRQDFLDLSKGLTYLMLNPQMQLIMLGFMISYLLWLYAVFGEMIPSLRVLESQGISLGSSLTMVIIGTIVTLTLIAIQVTILSLTYIVLSDVTALITTYLLAFGILVAYLLMYVGFFLVFDKLGRFLGVGRLVTAGVLVLVSAFIIFLGPVAWFISFTTTRKLLSTAA
ncbi:MAG: hypothetical protein ACK416_02075 [Zestosphaera sp.]